MEKKIKLYIVDTSETLISKLEEVFFDNPQLRINVIGYSQRFSDCASDFELTRQADVFLVSTYLPDKNGVELITHLKRNVNPNAKFIATVTSNTRNLADEALEKGAEEYLIKPFTPQKVVDIIHEIFGIEIKESSLEREISSEEDFDKDDLESFYGSSSYEEEQKNIDEDEDAELERLLKGDEEDNLEEFVYPDEDEEISSDEDEEESKQNEKQREILDMFEGIASGGNIFRKAPEEYDKPNIVCVFSSAKSAGKTTTLVNVAAAIKKYSEYNPRICIVDLNLLYPAITLKFHHEDLKFSSKDIYDMAADLVNLDEEYLNKAMVVHEPTGIKILNTPFEYIGNFNKINSEKIQNLITQLRDYFDLILIDTSGNMQESTTNVPITFSDKNIILFESDLASILHTRKFINIMEMIEKNFDKKIIDNSYFVLNRYSPKSGLSIEDVKGTIFDIEGKEIKIPLLIPDEPIITKLSNGGRFIIDSKTEAKEKILELAELIYPFYTDEEEYEMKKNYEDQSLMDFLKNKWKKK